MTLVEASPISALVYVSEASLSLDAEQLQELGTQASERNRELAITGFLVFNQRHFVQYLEGPHEALQTVYASIGRDPRHTVIEHRDLPTDERRFVSWNMEVLDPAWRRASMTHAALHELLVTDANSPPERISRIIEYMRSDQGLWR